MPTQESLLIAIKCCKCGQEDKPRITLDIEDGSGHGYAEYRCATCKATNQVTLTKEEVEKWKIKRQKAVLKNSSMMSELEVIDDLDAEPVVSVRKSYQVHLECTNCHKQVSPIVHLTIDPDTGAGYGSSKCNQCLFRIEVYRTKQEVETMQELNEAFEDDIKSKLPGEEFVQKVVAAAVGGHGAGDAPVRDGSAPAGRPKRDHKRSKSQLPPEEKENDAPHTKVSREQVDAMIKSENSPNSPHHAKPIRMNLMVKCSSCGEKSRAKFKINDDPSIKVHETIFKCTFCLRKTKIAIEDQVVEEYKSKFGLELWQDGADPSHPDDDHGETGGGLVTISKLVDHVMVAEEQLGKHMEAAGAKIGTMKESAKQALSPRTSQAATDGIKPVETTKQASLKEIPIDDSNDVAEAQGGGCFCVSAKKKKHN